MQGLIPGLNILLYPNSARFRMLWAMSIAPNPRQNMHTMYSNRYQNIFLGRFFLLCCVFRFWCFFSTLCLWFISFDNVVIIISCHCLMRSRSFNTFNPMESNAGHPTDRTIATWNSIDQSTRTPSLSLKNAFANLYCRPCSDCILSRYFFFSTIPCVDSSAELRTA